MATSTRAQISPKEANLLLAISAFQSGQFSSVNAAATAFNVSKTTLLQRMKGKQLREDYTLSTKALTICEEKVIVRDILKLDSQGLSPNLTLVKEIVDAISKVRGGPRVGVN